MIIKFTLDRFEGDKAVLITADGAVIAWPKDKLPDGLKEGSVIDFRIQDDKLAEEEKKETAKKIINEILDA